MNARSLRKLAVLIIISTTTAAYAADVTAEDVRKEIGAVNGHIYESFEKLPIRGWADQFTPPAFWQIQNAAQRLGRGQEPVTEDKAQSVAGQFEHAMEQIIKKLKVQTFAEITFTEDGTPALKTRESKLMLYKNVPNAIVFAVKPSSHSGKLTVTYGELSVDTDQRKLLTDYIVIPVTAEDSGSETVSLKLSANGKTAETELNIDVLPAGKLVGKVTDADNEPLVGKLFVEAQDGRLYVLPGHTNFRTQNWYGYYQPRFSYVDGGFEMPLPPGTYHVTLSKGYSYSVRERDIEVKADAAENVTLELKKLEIAAGWHSADMHSHSGVLSGRSSRPQETRRLIEAEGLEFAASTLYSTSRPAPMRVHEDVSDDSLLLFDQQEIEHWNFGNSFYINAPHTATDPDPKNPEITPMFFYDRQIHEMGGTTMRWIRSRPFAAKGNGQQQPELAVDIPLGHLDVFQLLNNTQQEGLDRPNNEWTPNGWAASSGIYERTYKTYYALLNCGLRVPISAGTSYGRLSRLGFNRVYVNIEKPFTLPKFAAALKKGDGFVTNGPLLILTANGRLPGDGVQLEKNGDVELKVRMQSNWPVDLVELLQNGNVVKSVKLDSYKGKVVELTHKATVDKPSWFAARCFGVNNPRYPHSAARNQFAHTNPLFVTINGKKPSSPEDAKRFITEIDALLEFCPNIPESMREETLSEFKKARKFYEDMASDTN